MTNRKNLTHGLLLLAAAAVMLMTASCGEKPRSAVGKLDTPEHHTLRGHDFIDEGKWKKAEREFNLAISLDKEFGPALAGQAVVMARNSSVPGIPAEERKNLAEKADDLLDDALDEAKTPDQERDAHVAGIRVQRLAKPDSDWLDEAEDHYEEAVDLDDKELDSSPHFFMARCYRDNFVMDKATALYQKVLGMNRGRTKQADDELAILQKVQRAAPGSRHGKVIAFEPSVTRADISALFVSELKLAALYARGSGNRKDNSFKTPGKKKFQTETLQRAEAATDIKNHPMRSDIEEVLKLRVLGLEPDPAHLFHPNAYTTRAEFAIMVEDILVKVTGERGLKTKFIGQKSPFPDVRNDLPYFNAVQTVVTRSLMEPKNKIRAEFAPMDPVSGADALLVIRQIKNELQSYLRPS